MSETIVSRVGEAIGVYPQALGHVAGVADSLVNGIVQVALVGDPSEAAFRALTARLFMTFVPSMVVAGGSPADGAQPSLMNDRVSIQGRPTAYVCRGFSCDLPTTDPDELGRQLQHRVRHGAADALPRHS